MTAPILNLADVPLQPRPPEFQPPGRIAERIEARLGRIDAPSTGVTAAAAPAFRFIGRPDQQFDYWDGE